MSLNRSYTPYLLKSAIHFASLHEISPSELLAHSGCTVEELDSPYAQISGLQDQQAFLNLQRLLPLQGLGLELGFTTSLQQMGPCGLAISTCKDRHQGTRAWFQLWELLPMHIRYVHQTGDRFSTNTLIPEYSSNPLNIMMTERLLALCCNIASQLTGGQHPPKAVLLGYPAPSYHKRYEELFECPVLFEQPVTQILFPPNNDSLLSPDPRVHQAMLNLCHEMSQELRGNLNYSDSTRLMIKNHLPLPISLNSCARELGLSARSLRRHLMNEGHSFQEIQDRVRKDVALEKLNDATLSIEQVSSHCGYGEARSFLRAFKRWTGQSPAAYLQTKGSHSSH